MERTEPLISLKETWKLYKTHGESYVVLKNINLDIFAGEFVFIGGKSGSGKTTLLNILSGLLPATKGTVRALGQEFSTLSSGKLAQLRRENFGFVFQELGLIPYLTALENVIFPYLVSGNFRSDLEAAGKKSLFELGLVEKLHSFPAQLSQGQRTRVAIARAITKNPKVIFADEPTANLDWETAKETIELLKNLTTGGCTVIVASHEERIIPFSTNRVVIMDSHLIR